MNVNNLENLKKRLAMAKANRNPKRVEILTAKVKELEALVVEEVVEALVVEEVKEEPVVEEVVEALVVE